MDTDWRLVAASLDRGAPGRRAVRQVALTLERAVPSAIREPAKALPFAVSASRSWAWSSRDGRRARGAASGSAGADRRSRPRGGAVCRPGAAAGLLRSCWGCAFSKALRISAIVVTADAFWPAIAAARHQDGGDGALGLNVSSGSVSRLLTRVLPSVPLWNWRLGGAGAVFAAHMDGPALWLLVPAGLLWPATAQFPVSTVLR